MTALFLFIYLQLDIFLFKEKIIIKNPIHLLLEKISNIIIQSNDKTLEQGIWRIFDKNIIPELDLTSKKMKYKEMNSILQPINLLKNNHIFCIKYNIYEGCSNLYFTYK